MDAQVQVVRNTFAQSVSNLYHLLHNTSLSVLLYNKQIERSRMPQKIVAWSGAGCLCTSMLPESKWELTLIPLPSAKPVGAASPFCHLRQQKRVLRSADQCNGDLGARSIEEHPLALGMQQDVSFALL